MAASVEQQATDIGRLPVEERTAAVAKIIDDGLALHPAHGQALAMDFSAKLVTRLRERSIWPPKLAAHPPV